MRCIFNIHKTNCRRREFRLFIRLRWCMSVAFRQRVMRNLCYIKMCMVCESKRAIGSLRFVRATHTQHLTVMCVCEFVCLLFIINFCSCLLLELALALYGKWDWLVYALEEKKTLRKIRHSRTSCMCCLHAYSRSWNDFFASLLLDIAYFFHFFPFFRW